MEDKYKEFADFFEAFKEYDGNSFTGEAFARYADRFNVCKIEQYIYTAGSLTKKQVAYISSSEPDPEYYEMTRDINEDIKSVLRFFFKNYSPDLTDDQASAFRCFVSSIDIYLSYRYTIEAYFNIRYYETESGIPNLQYLIKFLKQTIASDIRDNEYFFSYFNIKQSSKINRFYGGDVAGRILTEYARKLNEFVNKEDGEFAALIGGDNFAIFLRSERLQEFIELIQGIKITVRYKNDAYIHSVAARAGIVYLDNSYVNIHVIINNASRCLTSARNTGKDYTIWPVLEDVSPAISPEFILSMEKDLLNDKFLVYYQPVVEVSEDGARAVAAESLARWAKDGSIIIPSKFIDAAGSDGMITKLDLYIIDKTCAFIANQLKENIPLLPINCNLSLVSLSDDLVVGKIIDTVNKYEIPSGMLGVEFKVPGNLADVKLVENAAMKLKPAGISITIDDFGTSMFSTKLMSSLPVDSIKLDCDKIDFTNPRSRIILDNLIDVSKKLGFTVICEKIDNPDTIEEFRKIGFTQFQTRVYEKAISERFFISRLKNPNY